MSRSSRRCLSQQSQVLSIKEVTGDALSSPDITMDGKTRRDNTTFISFPGEATRIYVLVIVFTLWEKMKYPREPPWVRTVVNVDTAACDQKRRLRELHSVLTKSRLVAATMGYGRLGGGFASRTDILLSGKVVTGWLQMRLVGLVRNISGCKIFTDSFSTMKVAPWIGVPSNVSIYASWLENEQGC
jgi:hypothetical protein